jgi:hypothetical protein
MIGMHRFLPSKAGNKGITMKSLKFSPLLKGRKTNIGHFDSVANVGTRGR